MIPVGYATRLGAWLLIAVVAGDSVPSGGAQGSPQHPTRLHVPPSTEASDTVFYEGFESGSFAAWDDRGHAANQLIITDPAGAAAGRRFLRGTYPAGGDAGWLTKFFMPGYDSLWVRLRVRFPANWRLGTKLISFYGSRIDDQWSATGKAGKCPNGEDFFATTLVTRPGEDAGPLAFYTYYPGMAREHDGVTCYGSAGDASARYVRSTVMTRGVWHTIEYFVKLNTPGRNDSMQKFWLDGDVYGQWPGISLRRTHGLRLNGVTVTMSAVAPQLQMLDVDEVLVTRTRAP